MSVTTQSHELSPFAAKNSSADANPRARYSNEQSESTSASRKGSSSSTTAIKGSLDTHHPRVWVRVGGGERAVVASGRGTTTLYRGVTQRLRGLGPDHVGHPHEVSQCPCAHLAHGRASMNFRRDLAYSKFSGHLFVHLPGCHQHHHLLFARGQCSEPLSHLRSIVVGSPPLAVAFDGRPDGLEHVLVPEWLRKKSHRASPHHPERPRNIAISGHHDYRQGDTPFGLV